MPAAEKVLAAQKKGPSAAERLLNWSKATRGYPRRYGTKVVKAGETLRFSLEKVRLTSDIELEISTTIKATHATKTSFKPALHAPYTLVRRANVSANLSYTPWTSSGVGAYGLMLCHPRAAAFMPVYSDADERKYAYMGVDSDSDGETNKLAFTLRLPLVTNERDMIGMILTQNQETQVDVEIDFNTVSALVGETTGFTYELGDITVVPVVTTWAIPKSEDGSAIPDLTIIKQVGEQKHLTVAGRDDYRLPTGATFRRIVFTLHKADGTAVPDSELGDLEVTFNTSDVVQKVPARFLTSKYIRETGVALPEGMWALDFTSQGLINYGGGRDYVDAERLNEFWLTIVHSEALNLTVTYETLAQMKG